MKKALLITDILAIIIILYGFIQPLILTLNSDIIGGAGLPTYLFRLRFTFGFAIIGFVVIIISIFIRKLKKRK